MKNHIALDRDGFLSCAEHWNEQVAEQLASTEGLALGEAHWEIILLVRRFYAEFDLSPAMRPLVNYVRLNLGPDKANSIYLMGLFPGSPARLAAKIAGLPKPDKCL